MQSEAGAQLKKSKEAATVRPMSDGDLVKLERDGSRTRVIYLGREDQEVFTPSQFLSGCDKGWINQRFSITMAYRFMRSHEGRGFSFEPLNPEFSMFRLRQISKN